MFLNLLYKNEYFLKFQDFFVIFIFGHFFCPFFKKVKKSWKKNNKKKSAKFVTIKNLKVTIQKYFIQVC